MKKRPARLKFRPVVYDGRPLEIYTAGGSWFPTPPGIATSVRVHDTTYRILAHSAIFNEPRPDGVLNAVILFDHRLIVVEARLQPHDMLESLWHEVTHLAIWHGRQADPTLAKFSEEQEEAVCYALGRALATTEWR